MDPRDQLLKIAKLQAVTAEILETLQAENETLKQQVADLTEHSKMAEAKLAMVEKGLIDPSDVHTKVASVLGENGSAEDLERVLRFQEHGAFSAGVSSDESADPFVATLLS